MTSDPAPAPAPLEGVSVHFVESTEDAASFLTFLRDALTSGLPISVDTETTGLRWWEPNFLRLVQVGTPHAAWALDARRWYGPASEGLSLLARSGAPVIFHNAKFDLHALSRAGLPVPEYRNVHDTHILHSLAHPLARHGLKPVAEGLFGPAAGFGQALLRGTMARNGWTWATIPTEHPHYWAYGALDTVLTARLFETLYPSVHPEAYEREMAVQAILFRAEDRGLRVDPDYTSSLRDTWLAEAADLHAVLTAAGIANPASNGQVTRILKAQGWEPDEWTDTGKPRLDKPVLAALEAEFPGIATPLLRYRRLKKWTASYLDAFLADRDADDRVHASINTMAARTGRMSITGPALQTLPRGPEIRHAIIPADDHSIYAIDYDTMELRMFAHFSQDPGLVGTLTAGEDLHRFCASAAYGVPPAEVTPAQRQIAKNTNFARLYGAGPARIAATAGVPEAEIRAYLSSFDARFPGAAQFIDYVERTAKERLALEGEPYINTTGGRRLPIEPDHIYGMVNYLIQGSCADLFKDAIIAVDAAGFGDNILCPVHDELLFEFPSTPDGEQAAADARSIMENTSDFGVPFTCGLDGPLPTWGAKYQ